MFIPTHVRLSVIRRAQHRCEYCGIAQAGQEATFHIDHVIPVSSGGQTKLNNLALACVSCSLRKGARETAADPNTGKDILLFNPRSYSWRLHFRWDGVRIVGMSPTGRATVEALALNRFVAQAIRYHEARLGRHPPPRHL